MNVYLLWLVFNLVKYLIWFPMMANHFPIISYNDFLVAVRFLFRPVPIFCCFFLHLFIPWSFKWHLLRALGSPKTYISPKVWQSCYGLQYNPSICIPMFFFSCCLPFLVGFVIFYLLILMFCLIYNKVKLVNNIDFCLASSSRLFAYMFCMYFKNKLGTI